MRTLTDLILFCVRDGRSSSRRSHRGRCLERHDLPYRTRHDRWYRRWSVYTGTSELCTYHIDFVVRGPKNRGPNPKYLLSPKTYFNKLESSSPQSKSTSRTLDLGNVCVKCHPKHQVLLDYGDD